ncbi:MAG: M42 family peptidase [Sphingomonadales bacterium]|nr:MAG: M42 family peptidase [Sphingomonadales bacterium]
MRERLKASLGDLMMIPGLSGHEGRVRRYLKSELGKIGLKTKTDRLGNLIATIPGREGAPSVMLFTHMDQLGLVVRKIEKNGLVHVERLGGVPERALAAQAVLFSIGEGRDVPGVIAHKSHHATGQDEKYKVVPYQDIYIDAGFSSAEAVLEAGIDIGAPVVYKPHVMELANGRIAGTSVDDRAGCAVVLEAARQLMDVTPRPTVHIVFSTLEEFNLRGAVTAAQMLQPDIAIQIDLILASDTPDMAGRGDVVLGGGPGMAMFSFHGRGTLNGTIPHPAMVRLFEDAAETAGVRLQKSAHIGCLTDSSYVQLVGQGVASIDMGFPMRYSHSALELCDLGDLEELTRLLVTGIAEIGPDFSLDRDDFEQ